MAVGQRLRRFRAVRRRGETREELMKNLHEAAEGCLTLNVELGQLEADDEAVEIAV